MQRYTVPPWDSYRVGDPVEDDEGDFVMHDEAQAVIAAKDAEIQRLRGNYFNVADAITASSKGVEDLCAQARAIRKARDEAEDRAARLESANAGLLALLGECYDDGLESHELRARIEQALKEAGVRDV